MTLGGALDDRFMRWYGLALLGPCVHVSVCQACGNAQRLDVCDGFPAVGAIIFDRARTP